MKNKKDDTLIMSLELVSPIHTPCSILFSRVEHYFSSFNKLCPRTNFLYVFFEEKDLLWEILYSLPNNGYISWRNDGVRSQFQRQQQSFGSTLLFLLYAQAPQSTYPVVGRDSVGPAVEISHRIDLQREVVQKSVGRVETGDLNAPMAPDYRRGGIRLKIE